MAESRSCRATGACWTGAPPGLLDSYHDERHLAGARTMLHTQAQVALRRRQDSAAQALRHLFLELTVHEQPLRHLGELIAGTDIRYPLPNPNHDLLTGTFAPDLRLYTDHADTAGQALRDALSGSLSTPVETVQRV